MGKIIAVCGIIGSGKNSIGDYLVKNHGYQKTSFASPVKDVTALVFGWDRKLLEGDTPESRDFRETEDKFWSDRLSRKITPRLVMQKIGTESFRDTIHPDIWIHSLARRIDLDKNWVITDARFPNELAMIRSLNGRVIHVYKDPKPEWLEWATVHYPSVTLEEVESYLKKKKLNIHSSEYSFVTSKMDYIIPNNGTLQNLYDYIETMLKSY